MTAHRSTWLVSPWRGGDTTLLPSSPRLRIIVVVFWVLAAFTLPLLTVVQASGWDISVYRAALRSIRAGRDPYLDGIARLAAYHERRAQYPAVMEDQPNVYVYPPLTLPVLRAAGKLPAWFSRGVYLLLYAVGAFIIVWAGMQAVEAEERNYFALFAPAAVFFPALLENEAILCGNVAYLLYGAVLAAVVLGWRRGEWGWFYVLVLAASCVKPQLLTLLALPVLSARDQWPYAVLTGNAGAGLLLLQSALWPQLFRHFLQAVAAQTDLNRDFGMSPAGLFAGWLFDRDIPYGTAALAFYLAYAIPLLGVLVTLARRFKDGQVPMTRWSPVLLTGVMLLNPRVIEYDLTVLTIPFALIVWRVVQSLPRSKLAAVTAALMWALLNVVASRTWLLWKGVAGTLLVTMFIAGAWQLFHFKPVPAADLAEVMAA